MSELDMLKLARNLLDKAIERLTPIPFSSYLKNVAELNSSDKYIPEYSQEELITAGAAHFEILISTLLAAPAEFVPREAPKTYNEIRDFLMELQGPGYVTTYESLSRPQQRFLSAIRKNYTLWAIRYNKHLKWLKSGASDGPD